MLPSQLETIAADDCQRQRKQGKRSSRLLITVLPCVLLFFLSLRTVPFLPVGLYQWHLISFQV
jgi:hypothetical protein